MLALTPREMEIARLLIPGATYSHIARIVGCSPRTVQAHVHSIAKKIGGDFPTAKSRVQVWADQHLKSA